MSEIMTVCGPIDPKDLGVTSMHEHILLDGTQLRRKYEKYLPEKHKGCYEDPIRLDALGLLKKNIILLRDNLVIADEALMAAELTDFKQSGGSAMVDMSSFGLRLSVEGIQRLSASTDVHIVTTTGFYTNGFWTERFEKMTAEQFEKHMVMEIEEGIDETGIKAGHIKVAIIDLNEREETVLKAAAQAANQTGASISVHPGLGIGSDGRRISDILIRAGMPPERIIIAHADGFFVNRVIKDLVLKPETWGLNLDYHHALLDRGINISIDCFGHWWAPEMLGEVLETDWQRLAGLIALLKAGYSNQIVLGTDIFCKMLTRRYGGQGYSHLTENIIPQLRDLGVSDYDIRQMTIENPARLLAK